jgi:3-deoxy-D-manno-octulosonic-acid transferase
VSFLSRFFFASSLPFPLRVYKTAMSVLEPVAALALNLRQKKGKEDKERLAERRGHAAYLRPEGCVVWVHGASVGETLTLIPLIEKLNQRGLFVLVTSGTLTSASLLARRLPAGALHQYMPLDVPRYTRRFLHHWQPDLVIVAESEIWPNTLMEIEKLSIPVILVNARMSERSFRRWHYLPQSAKKVLSTFSLCLAQGMLDGERLVRLGAPRVSVTGNMKYDVPPPPSDPHMLASLSGLVAGRPVWLAASTHPGEEEMIAAVHSALMKRFPDLLTIIVPRHPARGKEVTAIMAEYELNVGRRSRGERPERDINCYIVDTIGELGLFYRLASLAFMGGSLVEHGGQNPIEPAKLGCAILHGPYIDNFADVYHAIDHGGGAKEVADLKELASTVGRLLADGVQMRMMARCAHETVETFCGALDRTITSLEPFLLAMYMQDNMQERRSER